VVFKKNDESYRQRRKVTKKYIGQQTAKCSDYQNYNKTSTIDRAHHEKD